MNIEDVKVGQRVLYSDHSRGLTVRPATVWAVFSKKVTIRYPWLDFYREVMVYPRNLEPRKDDA